MGVRQATRAALGAGAGVVALVAWASPASAHTLTGVQPTDYRSRITSVSPAVPGVRLRLLDLGRRIELVNEGGTDVTVIGYDSEPYLRVGPTGVFENRRSPTTYRNRTPSGATTATTLPPQASATAPPEWHRVSDGHTATWRDHRTRWEGPDPPAVRAAPGTTQVVAPWTIELRRGETPVVVSGRITWVPGPNPLPWLLGGLALFGLTLSFGWRRRWGPPLAVAVVVVVAVDAVHSYASAAASGGPLWTVVLRFLLGGFVSTAAWVIGALALDPLRREQAWGLIGGGLAAMVIGLYAIVGAFSLGKSQLPTGLPGPAARAAVIVTLGVGWGLVAAAAVVLKKHPEMVLSPADRPPA